MLKASPPDKLRDEAVQWLLRLQSAQVTEQDRREFERWVGQSRASRDAYAAVQAQWLWMEQFKSERFQARDEALRYRPDIRPLRQRLVGWATAATVLLMLGAGSFSSYGWYGLPASHSTEVGGKAKFTLADGSQLELNTDSAVCVRMTHWRRVVELVRGEAFFTVIHDTERPFVVKAGAGTLTDVGTAFDVYAKSNRVEVAVQEGVVRVDGTQSRELKAGEVMAYDDRGQPLETAADSVANLTAWRQGQLSFQGRRLEEVLQEVGRYHAAQIRVADPKLRDLKVTGTFQTARLDSTLNAIAMTLPLQIRHVGEHEIVLESLER